jgi:Protein of unknown function (DUF3570)
MQLRRSLLAARIALVPLTLPGVAHAGIEDPETGIRFGMFADSDNVHVFTTGSRVDLDVGRSARASVAWDHEVVVIPAITAPPGSQEAVDAISGASRPISSSQDAFSDFRKTREQVDTDLTWRGLRGGYYVSDEPDYFAQKVSAGASRGMLGDDLKLDFGASYGWDRLTPVADADAGAPADRKTTRHWSVVATDVATPTTVVQGGVENNRVVGLQHNPYRTVWVAGDRIPERHPGERSRWDAFVKVNRYLPGRAALNLDYMLYHDDWGIASQTVGAKLHQHVGSGVVVRYRYRFYSQSSADFWRDEYTEPGGVDGFRTGDYRMGAFDAHLFGTRITWSLPHAPFGIRALEGLRAHLKVERYFNSNNFSANLFESGCTLSF